MIRKSFKAVKILVFDFYNCDGQGIYSLWLARNCQNNNIEKKAQAGGVMLTDKTKLQESNSMVLAQETDT